MVHSNYLGDDPTKERNMKEGKKKRRNEERQEGPYKGAEGTRELVVALVSQRKQTNKPRKAQTVTVPQPVKVDKGMVGDIFNRRTADIWLISNLLGARASAGGNRFLPCRDHDTLTIF